jgi:formylglycine-generating enzyme required for sulfatase activity
VGGKVVCSQLEAVSATERFALTRPATFAVGDKDEVDLGKGERLILAFIPSGSFRMGSAAGRRDERPVHDVTISRSFWMGAYPVTQAQWQAVMGSNPSYFKGPDLPVENVSWDDCQQFISRVNAKGAGTFRLPTEAEWEHACRAGSTGETHENLEASAWYWDDSGKTTHPVGQKLANAWGLYDMTGNIDEWCQDWYGKSYFADSPSIDPQGPPSGAFRVVRGGSFVHEAYRIRYAYRGGVSPFGRSYNTGFRIVRTGP